MCRYPPAFFHSLILPKIPECPNSNANLGELFATKNLDKLREINEILGRELRHVGLELLEPQEIDVAKVIHVKAKDAFTQTGKPTLVEDTGLEFAAWNGLPGALIKWFLKSLGNEGILAMLQNEGNRAAVAKTAVGFYDGSESHVFVGEIPGTISAETKGTQGFGWDSIFVPAGSTKTFAEMEALEKNAVSMRKEALHKLQRFFETNS